MRRDDLQAFYLDVYASLDAGFSEAASSVMSPVSDAEALDAIGRKATLIHWLTEPCEVCGGSGTMGTHSHVHASTGEHLGNQPINCLDCGGRGWVPCDGAMILHVSLTGDVPPLVGVPLDWLDTGEEL